MGRPGAGGSSGGHSSGGHASSRSSGGHHVGSSFSGSSSRGSRPGMGMGRPSSSSGRPSSSLGSGFSFNSRPSRPTPPPPPRPPRGYAPPPPPRGGFGYVSPPPRRRPPVKVRLTEYVITLVILLLFIFVIAPVATSCIGGGSTKVNNVTIPASTVNREKVNTGVGFINDCVIDEIGWFDNVSKTSKGLQTFYNETGVQPYVVFKAYDPSVTTDAQKQKYAEEWYESNITNEGTFLFMYFGEQNTDTDLGYMCYVNGKQIGTVMDAEAVDIFWAYVDSAWFSDMSMDDVVITAFNNTAKRIMTKTKTGADVGVAFFIALGVIGVGVVVIIILKMKFKRQKEENEEAARILNTPLETSSSDDDLLNKYNGS